ncbi:MAG: NADP-dependent oxidoreductase [Candidatus Nanopelagicales bacterium]
MSKSSTIEASRAGNSTFAEVVLLRHPDLLPEPDDFRIQQAAHQDLSDGQVRIALEWISIDPAMRTWAAANPGRGNPIVPGSVMRAYGVGRVIESRNDTLPPGELVLGPFGLREQHVSDTTDIRRVLPQDLDPASLALGILGHIGLSAYVGMVTIAGVTRNDTVVVTSAAGAVGSIAAQIAARTGAHVIGIVGSAEKAELCASAYGLPHSLIRDSPDLDEQLRLLAPHGVDVFFDNTGGPVHDLVMTQMAVDGRVVICGTIALDSQTPGDGPRHERIILDRSLTIRGFLQSRYGESEEQALTELTKWHQAGELTLHEHIVDGLDQAPSALKAQLAGQHLGKVLIRIPRPTHH